MEAIPMRLRFRSTTRRRIFAITIAIVAALLGATVELYRQHERFKQLCQYHSEKYQQGFYDAMTKDFAHDSREVIFRIVAKSLWHQAMARKYEYAASYPWFPVPPDTPQ